MTHHRGFTLIELLVTLSIASILIAVAVPSFRELSIRNRLTTYTNDFVATVNVARSEAVRRGSTVTVCKSDDGAKCGGAWSDGWIVFHDANGDGIFDEGNDTLVKTHEGLASSYTINASESFEENIIFGPDGSANASGLFAVCHKGNLKGARAIVLTRMRPRVGRDTDNNGIPNTDTGDLASCTKPA
jgi:type IV fimbrial biogenesis protein FimT